MGAVMTFATAAGSGFAGFLAGAVGWRPVCPGGGLPGVACAGAPELSRPMPGLPADSAPGARTTGP